MQYRITLAAGVEKTQQFQGSTLVLLSTGAAATVDLSVQVQGFSVEVLRGVRAGLKLRGPTFTGAAFLATEDCVIEVIVSNADLSINYQEGATVNANILDLPLPVIVDDTVPILVETDRGNAPGNPLFVSGLTLDSTPAASITNNAAVAVNAAGAVQVLPALLGRVEARLANLGTVPIAFGAAGLTWATRAVVVDPGDVWIETRGAALAWYGITEAAASSAGAQELRA